MKDTIQDFMDEYLYQFSLIAACNDPSRQAYLMTEKKYEEKYGQKRYSNYQSFKVQRSKYMKKLLKK